MNLVTIDSLSLQEDQMIQVLKGKLETMGFSLKIDEKGNIYGYLPGELLPDLPLLFSAHMDTVSPGTGKKAVLHPDGRITSEGDTVLGADNLAGVVSILESIRVIKENNLPHRSIEVLFTVAEEIYLKGSEEYNYSHIRSREAYVLDLGGPIGTAALQAPTVVSITASIKGRSAHAGFAPQEGINAIAIAAHAIHRIKQGKINEQTTVNIGQIDGGAGRNIVSESCTIKGEVRSLSHSTALEQTENIKSILEEEAKHLGGSISFETSFGCIAYKVEKDHPVTARYINACNELDITPDLVETFGGSDNNNFLLHNITGIVLACGMYQIHSCSEYTYVQDIEKCTELTIKLMTSEV